MPGSRLIDQLVVLLYLQSLAFVLSWGLAYLLGHRLKRAHWLLSLLFIAAVEAAAAQILAALGGGVPSTAGWIALGAVSIATIATTENWNAIGHASLAVTLSLSGLSLVYIVYGKADQQISK